MSHLILCPFQILHLSDSLVWNGAVGLYVSQLLLRNGKKYQLLMRLLGVCSLSLLLFYCFSLSSARLLTMILVLKLPMQWSGVSRVWCSVSQKLSVTPVHEILQGHLLVSWEQKEKKRKGLVICQLGMKNLHAHHGLFLPVIWDNYGQHWDSTAVCIIFAGKIPFVFYCIFYSTKFPYLCSFNSELIG